MVMSQPNESPTLDLNFQIVVFKVENTLFQVHRNCFNVPGTPFEAMFALPQTQTQSVEGSSLDNPIHLLGIKVDHFRSFLRILYPFIDRTPVVKFDEWVRVLSLSTLWLFQEIREKSITHLSELIKEKTVMERIALAREYRVAKWLRDAYLELVQQNPLNLEELRPAESYSDSLVRNWEADAIKWKATSTDWETLARISHLQTRAAISSMSFGGVNHCRECRMDYGIYKRCLCKCRLLSMVDEAFRGELESFKEYPGHVEHPLPS